MQLGLPFTRSQPRGPAVVDIGGRPVRVDFVRNRRARHYILRVDAAGGVRVTVPWHGSRAEAQRFLAERHEWIGRQLEARVKTAAARTPWGPGTIVRVRGEACCLRVEDADQGKIRVSFGDQVCLAPRTDDAQQLRRVVETRLRKMAAIELPERLARLALRHGFEVEAVSIRNQRSRWGSCSAAGRISLNWRLVQFPPAIADYVIIHELVHLHHLNHSRRFWADVSRLFPDFQEARAWLRRQARGEGGDA